MDDAGIAQLAKSIEKEGLTDLPLVRKLDDGSWQMVSGHRRKAAYAMLAEEDERYAQIPCRIIRGISDEQSVMLLHAANYFVRNLTVTERAAASRALGMEVERMRVENPELSGVRTEDIKAAIISEQTGRKVSGKTIQRQESLARKIEEDLVAGWREAALSDSLSADAVNALAKMEPDEQERLFSSWKEHPLDKKKTTEFLRKATSEPSAKPRQEEEQKPSAPLGSALRALRRYESKALGEPLSLIHISRSSVSVCMLSMRLLSDPMNWPISSAMNRSLNSPPVSDSLLAMYSATSLAKVSDEMTSVSVPSNQCWAASLLIPSTSCKVSTISSS